MVRVVDPGMLSTIQDVPRHGLARFGLSEAGAMAPESFREANWLAGNDTELPAIEVTMKAPRLLFLAPAVIGLGGADFGWRLDGKAIARGEGFSVRAGAMLHGDYCRQGLRGYIAFGGGLTVKRWYGSAATHVQAKLGGQILTKGDELSWFGGNQPRRLMESFSGPVYSGTHKILRVVEGPYPDWFGPEAFALLTATVYRVTEKSTRMALRLEGLPLPCPAESMVSAGAWCGAIQIPPSGIPQILGPDHPATGGYPIVGSVISADLEVMGQLRPREEIRFGRVSRDTARQLWKRQQDWWTAR
jgi:antagonist of KipI